MEIFVLIFGVVSSAVVGFFWWTTRPQKTVNLTLGVLASFLIPLLIGAPIYAVWSGLVKQAEQTYYEFWGGYETATSAELQACVRDGNCRHTYDCDPYLVTRIEFYTDSEGNSQSRVVVDTEYHSCPYSAEETTYSIDTTLGLHNLGAYMTGDPFRERKAIPGGKMLEPPRVWSEAKARIDAGAPGGAFRSASYENYILASQSSILKHYSAAITDYRERKLLPKLPKDVYDLYRMDKTFFLGSQTLSEQEQESLAEDARYLGGAVGTALHGDPRFVFVPAWQIESSKDYSLTLMAYWQSEAMGKHAIAKNTIVVVVGTERGENETTVVKWVRAHTGMPLGNERLLQQLESGLVGETIDENFIGRPTFNPAKKEIVRSGGQVENILFGANKFERVSMKSVDDDDIGTGFEYLASEWELPVGHAVGIFVTAGLLSSAAMFLTWRFMWGRLVVPSGYRRNLTSRDPWWYDPLDALFTPTPKDKN